MLSVAEKKLFRPNAVFIPTKDGKEGRDFDREDCALLFVDGTYSEAEVFTEEAWRNDGDPVYIQRRGDFFLPDDTEIPIGKVQLLPDACIVKIPEREYWCEEVQEMTKRIFRRLRPGSSAAFSPLRVLPSYELWFLESQYEDTDEVAEDEDKRNELNESILEGDAINEAVSYVHRKEIDPMFLRGRRCRPGWLPAGDHGGGYRLRGLRAVTWEGILEEINEMRCNLAI